MEDQSSSRWGRFRLRLRDSRSGLGRLSRFMGRGPATSLGPRTGLRVPRPKVTLPAPVLDLRPHAPGGSSQSGSVTRRLPPLRGGDPYSYAARVDALRLQSLVMSNARKHWGPTPAFHASSPDPAPWSAQTKTRRAGSTSLACHGPRGRRLVGDRARPPRPRLVARDRGVRRPDGGTGWWTTSGSRWRTTSPAAGGAGGYREYARPETAACARARTCHPTPAPPEATPAAAGRLGPGTACPGSPAAGGRSGKAGTEAAGARSAWTSDTAAAWGRRAGAGGCEALRGARASAAVRGVGAAAGACGTRRTCGLSSCSSATAATSTSSPTWRTRSTGSRRTRSRSS